MSTVTVNKRDLQGMLLSAFRYSLGRTTYITSECDKWLIKHWDDMPEGYKIQINGDIRNAIDRGHAGHDCDVATWKKILTLPIEGDK